MNQVKDKTLKKLDTSQRKIINKSYKANKLKQTIYSKVPKKLISALESAFIKAFEGVFLNGTAAIEKTFDKENLKLEYDATNFIINKKQTRKTMKKLDKPSNKSNAINHTATTAAGLGLGFLGLGLPDIPLFVGTMLKGIYEIAISYGISYDSEEEKIYILRLIRLALAQDKKTINDLLDLEIYDYTDIKTEMQETAKLMADALLVEKFMQGIPIVGMVGGVTNWATYRKVSKIAVIKYKTRYIKSLK